MSKKSISKCLLLGSVIAVMGVLTACGPHVPTEFGVPKTQFDKMSKAQQQQTIRNYNQQQRQSAEDQTAWDLLGAAGGLIHVHKTLSSSSSESCSGPASNRTCTGSSSSSSFNIN
ncbi:MAG: hypothetical protein P1U63_04970 [Coxiellaceae bacterium]|nr:hypothetical protein [Coxiellaceae bacterium]